MATPKEFRDLVNEEKLTNEIIAQWCELFGID